MPLVALIGVLLVSEDDVFLALDEQLASYTFFLFTWRGRMRKSNMI